MDRSVAKTLNAETPFLKDPAAQQLCAMFENAGHIGLFVGGCVRNAVMGAAITDIDVATDAIPDQVIALCADAGLRSVPTGIDHGTVTVVVQGTPFEVTTFRKDVATDGRRAVVAFSSDITEDAQRRDFTMNALYADRHGNIHDPVHGYQDAVDRRVRFIDDAGKRICEDFLRILRYFRFSAQYAPDDAGWDQDALDGIASNLDGLDTLSAERVGSEILKLLAAPDPSRALWTMQHTGVLPRILPGADPTFVGPLVHAQALADVSPDPVARLAALGGQDVQGRLRLSRKQARHLDSIRHLSASSDSAKAIGFLGGAQAGSAALLLRSVYGNIVPNICDIADIRDGAAAEFPIQASDLPSFSGPALGRELARLKAVWLASDLSIGKDALLQA